MLLILTQREEDATVVRLTHILQARGADVVVVAQSTLEGCSSLRLEPNGAAVLQLEHRTINLRDVRSAWLWRSWRPERLLPRFKTLRDRRREWLFYETEWLSLYRGFSMLLGQDAAFCVNPPPFNSAFEEKICQLYLAAQVGLSIPSSLYTTRLPVARAFSEQHADDIIYKPFKPYLEVIEGHGDRPTTALRLLSNRVRSHELEEQADYFPTPGIFQPYVPKQLELRVVVVGRHLFTCAIHSQQSDISREDWRRYDFPNTPYEPYQLPDAVADKIRALMDRLGLVFSSVDLVLTPDGEYVFLE